MYVSVVVVYVNLEHLKRLKTSISTGKNDAL